MPITLEDYHKMDWNISRVVKTENSEEYLISSDNPDAGAEGMIANEERDTRVGYFTVHYIKERFSRDLILGKLILEADWEEEAYSKLIDDLKGDVIESFGAGIYMHRSNVLIAVYQGEYLGDLNYSGEYSDINLQQVRDHITETKQLISNIPDEISQSIDEMLEQQYEEIEEIIQSEEMDKQEKMKKIHQNIRIGLEKGLPTLFYGRESTEER